jgi:hypothetical protein
MSNKTNKKVGFSNLAQEDVIESVQDEIHKTSDQSTRKCPEYFYQDDKSRWLYWIFHYFKPWCLKNGSHEFLFEGTINGRTLADLQNGNPCIYQITETVRNVALYEKFVKGDAYRTRINQVFASYVMLLPILRKPVMVDDGAGNMVRQLLHPSARTHFALQNIQGMRRQIPGLMVPTAAELLLMSPEEIAADLAAYNVHFSHVPRNDNDWLPLVFPHAANHGDCPPIMRDFERNDLIDEVLMAIFNNQKINKDDLKASYAAAKVANPAFNVTPRQFCARNIDPPTLAEINK